MVIIAKTTSRYLLISWCNDLLSVSEGSFRCTNKLAVHLADYRYLIAENNPPETALKRCSGGLTINHPQIIDLRWKIQNVLCITLL